MNINPWILAMRPKTLPAAIAPVLIGTAMAFGDGAVHLPSALAALVGALMIQIATNLINDYGDFRKGTDKDRVGPLRVTEAGLIAPQAVLMAAAVAFVAAVLCALYLITRAGNVIVIIAVASILSGIFYTIGRRPLGYLGLGDVFVFVFFGPVAVAGTYYVQTLDMNWAVLAAGIAPGLLSTAVLAVNNLRDMDGDRRCGKMTLAVRFGRGFACAEFVVCILGAMITPFVVNLISDDHQGVAIAALVGFLAIPSIRTIYTSIDPNELNQLLAKTGQLLLIYTALFSAGWIACSR